MISSVLKPKSREEIIETVESMLGPTLIEYLKMNRTKSINILKAFTYIASRLEEPPEKLILVSNYPTSKLYHICIDQNAVGERIYFRGGRFSHAIIYRRNLALLKERSDNPKNSNDFMLISKEKIIKNIMLNI